MGETGDFFRIPAAWDDQFWTNFKERLNAIDDCGEKDRLYHSLIGVPGFFWDDEHDRPGFVYFRNSLGILLHSLDGLICGIDMRLPADAPQELGTSHFHRLGSVTETRIDFRWEQERMSLWMWFRAILVDPKSTKELPSPKGSLRRSSSHAGATLHCTECSRRRELETCPPLSGKNAYR